MEKKELTSLNQKWAEQDPDLNSEKDGGDQKEKPTEDNVVNIFTPVNYGMGVLKVLLTLCSITFFKLEYSQTILIIIIKKSRLSMIIQNMMLN
jgi:hypothetical protein